MKKHILTSSFILLAASLAFASPDNNWLRLESQGPDVTLAGAAVPSGTVYNVLHEKLVEGQPVQTIVFSNVTDEVGWYPESVTQLWDPATGQGYASGTFTFALFDDAHGEGAIARCLASAPAAVGEVIKLAADPTAPYEIVDTNRLTSAILVGPGVTLNVRAFRSDYQIDPASTGTIAVDLTVAEIEDYYGGKPIAIPLSSGGEFAGQLNLIDTDGETVLPSTAEVVEDGGAYYLAATKAEVDAGYVDIPFVMTANNVLTLNESGSFGGSAFNYSTNMTVAMGVNYAHNANNTSGTMGSGTYFWYSTSAVCTFISTDHYPAVNCQLKGRDESKYWQIDIPIDFGSRTFKLGSAQAGYYLCNGQGNWQSESETRVFASTITVLDENGKTIGTLGRGETTDFGYQTIATNTMSATSAIELTGKICLRLKAWLKNQSKNETYSGCTGIKLLEMAGGEYTAMLTENADFSDLTWAPRRTKVTSDDHLIVKAKADALTLTLDEPVTAAVLRVTGEGFTTAVAGLNDNAAELAALDIDAGAAVKIAAWDDAGSKLSGTGTLVIDTGAKATPFTGVTFGSFAGDVVIAQGTWTGTFPQQRPFAVDGVNAVLSLGKDSTGYTQTYPALRVINGGTLTFSSRDTFSRELVLENGGNLVLTGDNLDSGRAFDFFNNSSLTVNGTEPCRIGGANDGIVNSGIIAIRRGNLPITVEEGAVLDIYAQWGYNTDSSLGNACVKNGEGLVAFYRAPAQTGAFTVNAGTLKLVDAGAPTTGTITMAAGTTLICETTEDATQALPPVVMNGSIVIRGAGTTKISCDLDACTLEAGATLDLNGHVVSGLTGAGTVVDSVGTGKLAIDELTDDFTLNCSVELSDGVVVRAANEEALATLVGEQGSVAVLGKVTILIDGSTVDKNWKAEGRGFVAQPFDSISVNIKGGNNSRPSKAIADANTAGVVPVTGAQWSQVITRSGSGAVDGALDSGDKLYEVMADGSRVESAMTMTPYAACCYTAGTATQTGNGELMFGYLDDGEKHYSGKGASIDLANIPYSEYTLYIYLGTDQGDSSGKQFGPVYVNGVAYPSNAAWGSPAAVHETSSAIKLVEGQNFIRVTGLTTNALSIVGSKNGSPSNTRCGIAGFQIINTGVRRYEAKIGDVYYLTLQNALDVGGDVELLKHVTNEYTIAAGKTINLDLGGYSITANAGRQAINNYGTLSIANGAVTAGEAAIVLWGNSTTTINGGIYQSTDNAVLMGSGNAGQGNVTLTVNGGTFTGGITTAGYIACGVYVANGGTYNISGGTFNITGGVGVLSRAGLTTINGATFNVTAPAAPGKIGDKAQAIDGAVFAFDASDPAYPGYVSATDKILVEAVTLGGEGYLDNVGIYGTPTITKLASIDTLTAPEGYEWKGDGSSNYETLTEESDTPSVPEEQGVIVPVPGEENTYVVSNTTDTVDISNLPDGATVKLDPSVNTVTGVASADQIKVVAEATNETAKAVIDITPAFTISEGTGTFVSIALNPATNVVVQIGDSDPETIPVTPVLSETTDAVQPLVVDDTNVTVGVKTIPGLKYQLVRSTAVDGTYEPYGEAITAKSTRLVLDAAKGEDPAAFHKVQVTK